MAKRDLKAFMRPQEADEIVRVPGPATFKDENGKPMMLEVKIINQTEINKIHNNYTKRTMATDDLGNPVVVGNEVAFATERDTDKVNGHILAEALVYPDLKDKELMAFYKCNDIAEMAVKVFSRPGEMAHVNRVVLTSLGLWKDFGKKQTESTDSEINEIKN